MNLNSIIVKISIVFLITLVLFIAVFFAYLEYKKKEFRVSLNQKYTHISKNIHKNRMSPEAIEEYLRAFNLILEKEPRKLKDTSTIIVAGKGFELLKYKNDFYFHFHTSHFKIMFKDMNTYEHSNLKYVLSVFVFILFIFIYYLIIKNIKNTNLLLDSRQLFLRTVMHELKTPIAKGRIVSELIDDEKQKNRMIIIFEKLNVLIDDFSKIEEVVSDNYTPNKYKYKLDEIIKKSIDMLMLESNENIILQNISTQMIDVDLDLFSLAIKNIIDNGLKYSSDGKIVLNQVDKQLLIISKGEILSKPLTEYFKPFHNNTTSKTHGMGLGLYIVKSILDIHQFTFEYEHKDGYNIFKIELA
ncbi:MAG: HAMP domain-containing histidine kinase [Sulfurimonas sp.]|nr:HAMP domain-containing histidine kinase [Sulfurimonas sp.]